MTQVLIATGDPGHDVRPLFAHALAVQCTFSRAQPVDRVEDLSLCLATWRTESGKAPVLDVGDEIWRVGAGTWVGPLVLPALESAKTLRSYNGAFVFAAGRKHDGSVLVATDPIGSLHVYTTVYRSCTLISTSSLVLAAVSGADWDLIGVREFLAKGSVFGTRTLHQRINKVKPGCIAGFQGATQTTRQSYCPIIRPAYGKHKNERIVAEFATVLTDAVGSTLDRVDRPIMDLTGGFDSRLLLAAALHHRTAQKLDCTVTGEAGDGDAVAANRIARTLGIRLTRRPPLIGDVSAWWTTALDALAFTDGEADVLEYANTLAIQRAGLMQFDGSINGSGGELIRGYWWELLWPHAGASSRFDTRRVAAARFAHDPWAESLLAAPFDDTLTEHFTGVLEAELRGLDDWPNTALMDRVYLRLRMQRWQGRLASATNRIWPCFAPLLYRPVVETAFDAPASLRRNGRMARAVLQYMSPRLAALPMADGTPASPVTIASAWRHLPRYRDLFKRAIHTLHGGRLQRVSDTRLAALLQLDATKAILRPDVMYTRNLYRDRELADLLNRASAGEVSDRHLGKIVTLELVKRAVAQVRQSYSLSDT